MAGYYSDSDDGGYNEYDSGSGCDMEQDEELRPKLNRGFLNWGYRSMNSVPQLRHQMLKACCTIFWRVAYDPHIDDEEHVGDWLQEWCDDGHVNIGVWADHDPRYVYIHFGPFDHWNPDVRNEFCMRLLVLRVERSSGNVTFHDNRVHRDGLWYVIDIEDEATCRAVNTLRHNVVPWAEKRHGRYLSEVDDLEEEWDDLCYDGL